MFTPLNHQTSFSSVELSQLSKSQTAKFLEKVNQQVKWREFEQKLESLYCADNGRPSFSPVTLLKGLLLEQWYELSDKALEEELKDRLSFRNFVGLNSDQDGPDETTFVKFRNKLREHNLEETLFKDLSDQLRKDNLKIKQGKCLLVDATLIESPFGKEPKGKDGNGDFIKRGDEITKGYKAHLAVNQKDGLIESAIFTVASCHESGFLERTLDKVDGNIISVIGDKGYWSDERKRTFRQKGIYCGILDRKKKNQSLSKKQQRKNKVLSKIRGPVERVFAVVKTHYRFFKVRYFGLRRNAGHMFFVFFAYNLQLATLRSLNTGPS